MANRGTLEKVQIRAYEQPDYSGSAKDTWEAFVNPGELTIAYEHEFDSAQGGGTKSRMNFKKAKPGDLTLAFFLDGTGANGTPLVVQEAIEHFQAVTGYNGNIHRPNYLVVAWGTMAPRRCVLKSASILYKLFKPDGVPLRAVITAVFTDNSDDKTRAAEEQNKSPDLTHVRVVKAGENLPWLCNQIYGSPDYYLEVAAFNKLTGFRNLQPGTRLVFPPLEK